MNSAQRTHRTALGRAVLGAGALLLVGGWTSPPPASAQDTMVPRIPMENLFPFSLTGPARPGQYMAAVGARSAWLGFETGEGEVWVHPLKVLKGLGLRFSVPQYAEAIPGRQVATRVTASPGHAQVVYSHEGFVVRQHVLAPPDLPGILILLDVDAVVDLSIEVVFEPVLQAAWPGGFGGQYLFWDETVGGFVLSESLRRRNAVIGSPWASEASAHPAHRLAEAPSVFVIPVDPDRARTELIPIAIAGSSGSREEALASYSELLGMASDLPGQLAEGAAQWLGETLQFSVERPLGEGSGNSHGASPMAAVEWAKINLAEQRVCNPDLGCGLVAGWGPSGTSLRPGFGWFFGGDAAINTMAMDATGQWEEVAEALRFLARYQREDGKIPHEISQSAGGIPWFQEFPYAYYHADTTPYWMVALWQYWRASGDDALLRELWPALEKAYRWCLSVETDGDGIIENTTGGLGAIEVGGLGEGIHQDIYLAAVWTAALRGTGEMARAVGAVSLASEAQAGFTRARETLNRRYWMPEEGYHAFGILQGGGTNGNLTAWPSTALAFGLLEVEEAEGTLSSLARETISSSWGARLLSTESELYDPLHYNNGMVWPFMTGFVAWAQFRYRRPWAGYPLLEALWRLHADWSLGRHPENLSGATYQTLDATVPHQFFASSMLLTPLARGLLGWDPDAPGGSALLAPQPHPAWGGFSARNLRVGNTRIHLSYRREGERAEVQLESEGPEVRLTFIQGLPLGAREIVVEGNIEAAEGRQETARHDVQHRLDISLGEGHPVYLTFRWVGGLEVYPTPDATLLPGSRSRGTRILDFRRDGEDWLLTVEGEGGTAGRVTLVGESVEPDLGRILRDEATEAMVVEVPFPADGPRVIRTVRLRPRTQRPGPKP